MNSLRMRVAKLKPDHGVGSDLEFAIQISTDDLIWWTIARKKVFDQALEEARRLHAFISSHIIAKEEAVMWKANV